MILAIMLPLLAARATAEVACYQCYGNSMDPELNATDRGQLCSIDRLCLGQSCYFNVQETGEWSAGCSDRIVPPLLICTENYNETACHCMGDLCNQFKSVNETLLNFWDSQNDTAFSNVSLVLPGLPVHCIECGNVTVNGRTLWVPCAERHICRGDFCVTKRGLHPHSFCGSIWDGSDEERCLKQAGEEETCVCKTNMCNVVLSPEALEAMMRPTTTTTTRPTMATTQHRPTTTTSLEPIITEKPLPPLTSLSLPALNTTARLPATEPIMTISTNNNNNAATYTTPTITTKSVTSQAPSESTNTTQAPETVPTATTSPTTPPKTKKCKNTMKFSPNAQAVLMGQKLGQVISGGFGTDSNAVKEFNDGVDTHICNYE